jgi:hypothetical protein
MTKAVYVENQKFYTYHEGALTFRYWPDSGRVELNNSISTLRGVEYFVDKGFKVKWGESNPSINMLRVELSEELKPFEKDIMAGVRKDSVLNTKVEADKLRKDTLKKNVDNTTGEVLNLNSLETTIHQFTKSTRSRQNICDWFNQFNLEDARREDFPVMSVSSKNKASIIEDGKKAFDELKKEGKLRKLTQKQLESKLLANDKAKENKGE